MAEQKFFSILTPHGMEKTTGTFKGQPSVKPIYMAFGDGDGSEYTPEEGQKTLKKQVYETELSNLYIDPQNPHWIVAEAIIPRNVGGFWIRELSVRDENHIDIAIGNLPARYKPLLEEGAPMANVEKLIFQVSNTQNVEFSITPFDGVTREEFEIYAAKATSKPDIYNSLEISDKDVPDNGVRTHYHVIADAAEYLLPPKPPKPPKPGSPDESGESIEPESDEP